MRHLLLFTLFSILAACEPIFYIQVPITDKASEPIDTSLLGYWSINDDKSDTVSYLMKISELDNERAFLDFLELKYSALKEGWSSYILHTSTVDKINYINLQATDGKHKSEYIIAKYEITNDTLKTWIFTEAESNNDFKKSKTLKKYMQKNKKEVEERFDDFLILKRYNIKTE